MIQGKWMSKLNLRCGGPLFVCTGWLTCIGVCRALYTTLHRRPRAVRFRNEGLVRVEPPPLRRHLPSLVARQGKNHAPSCLFGLRRRMHRLGNRPRIGGRERSSFVLSAFCARPASLSVRLRQNLDTRGTARDERWSVDCAISAWKLHGYYV